MVDFTEPGPGLNMDPITFEVLRSAFDAAADEMGMALRKAAKSTTAGTPVKSCKTTRPGLKGISCSPTSRAL